jgi:hypothetical protein
MVDWFRAILIAAHDLGDVGMPGADGGPGVFQGGDQAARGTVDRWRGGHGLVSWPGAGMAGGAAGWPLP